MISHKNPQGKFCLVRRRRAIREQEGKERLMGKSLRKSTLFLDTTTNKVDAKGRVSIPADYRALLEEQDVELVAFRSFTASCIECRTSEMMEKMANDIESSFDTFSDEQDDLTSLIFSDSKAFPFDSTGRILLTEKLLKHAQITDKALFVGKGRTFQIWNPEVYQQKEEQMRQNALNKHLTLRKRES